MQLEASAAAETLLTLMAICLIVKLIVPPQWLADRPTFTPDQIKSRAELHRKWDRLVILSSGASFRW